MLCVKILRLDHSIYTNVFFKTFLNRGVCLGGTPKMPNFKISHTTVLSDLFCDEICRKFPLSKSYFAREVPSSWPKRRRDQRFAFRPPYILSQAKFSKRIRHLKISAYQTAELSLDVVLYFKDFLK
jgi:hypothetical protein